MRTMMMLAQGQRSMTLARAPLPMRLAVTSLVLLLNVALVFGTAGVAIAAPVPGTNVLYTLDADFEKGTLLNVNHNAPNNNQLQLNKTTKPFPFVNIAASGRGGFGTILRIDANTGAILGEFQTAPDGLLRNPSRTTVDTLGNVWVANRDDIAECPVSSGISKGSVARIGLILGGTRADADGTPNPIGQYLSPPFQYNTCVDRNGDGLIKTSNGLGNVLSWTNTVGEATCGGVSTAEDECIINYTRVAGTGTRTVAVDANNDVWVGGINNTEHEKLSGITGQPIPGTQFNLGCGGYGGLVDGNNVLWSSSPGGPYLLRFDATTFTGVCRSEYYFNYSIYDYGLGIDPKTGNIWHSSLYIDRIAEIAPDGTLLAVYPHGNYYAQGVAVDGNSNVWVASSLYSTTVGHLRTDGTFVGNVEVGNGPTGVAVDANGKIWAANYYGWDAVRIDPNAGPIGGGGFPVGAVDLTVNLGDNAYPYNYSDMTGFVSIGATAPQGSWTVVQDSGAAGTEWGNICWNTEPQGSVPEGASITVEARAADTEAGLSSQTFVPVGNCVPFTLTGRFVEVQATLKANSAGVSPVLSDIRIRTSLPPQVLAGHMNGGGSVFAENGMRVTHGFHLYCDAGVGPNHLQINWGKGNKFHLESLTSAYCYDDPAIAPNPPAAGFDTYLGKGTGRFNGMSGATAEWTLTDAGEPGSNDNDYAKIIIKDASDTIVLTVSGVLDNGNHQAHAE